MTIEKTFKLTIKDHVVYLTEKEVSEPYEQCRKALNIKYINDFPTTPDKGVKPTIPYPYDTYPWYTPKYPPSPGYPYWTGPTTTTNNTTGINFLSDDDIAVIEDNQKWRSSVEQALDKLKNNNTTTTSEGIKVG